MPSVIAFVRRLLYPPRFVLCALPSASFALLVAVFAMGAEHSIAAVPVFVASAYSLSILVIRIPGMAGRVGGFVASSRPVRWFSATGLGGAYARDEVLRDRVGSAVSIATNLPYAALCIVAAVQSASAWFASLAAYYIMLDGTRAYVGICQGRARSHREFQSVLCRRVGWLMLAMNVPMGAVITLMVVTDSAFHYEGFLIYGMALCVFCSVGAAAVGSFRAIRSKEAALPVSRALGLVSALMSLLGLQTAMIARFSAEGAAFRITMNALTGLFVFVTVIFISARMIVLARKP